MSKFYDKSIPTEYKYVYKFEGKNFTYFRFMFKIKGKTTSSPRYSDVKTCALNLDKFLINNGKEPINILKRK